MRLALVGGEEFADGFEDVHADLLAANGGKKGVFLPSAATDDGLSTVQYWCNLACKRLSIDGMQVEAPAVVDAASANDARTAQLVADADWIYLGGGKPHVAMRVLGDSKVMAALLDSARRGALIIGASAGAMMMCTQSIVLTDAVMGKIEAGFRQAKAGKGQQPEIPWFPCLNFVPDSVCLPHFNRPYAHGFLDIPHPGFRFIGIDEQTALTNVFNGGWEVRGRGSVVLVGQDNQQTRYKSGEKLVL